MNSSEQKIRKLEQELSRLKNEKTLYYCIAKAAEQREAQATEYASSMKIQFFKERALRVEAERRLQEEMQQSFNLKKYIEKLSGKEQTLCAVMQEKQALENQLAEALKKIRRLEKKLNIRKGTEDPYGLSTPSSRKIAKANSTEENQNKKGGAVAGHPGHGRKQFKKDQADEVRRNSTISASSCCAVPEYEEIDVKVNSYIDFVPSKMKIIYEENLVYQCRNCGKKTVSRSPFALPKAKYSNTFVGTLLNEAFGNLMPFGSIAERYGINKGTLIDIFHRTADIFEPVFKYIRDTISNNPVVHADETTWSVDGKRAYSWLFATKYFRLYLFRDTRASSVAKEVFTGNKLFDLTLVTDRYGGYNALPVRHQYCYVHLLRDLKKLETDFSDDSEVKKFVDDFEPLLKDAIGLRKKDLPIEQYKKTALNLKKQIMVMCQSPAQHPGIQSYQDIFRNGEDRLFQWTMNPNIPCENNFAERNLRPVVIARKISFGCQSAHGMHTREILMTVIQSIKCHGLNPFFYIHDVLTRTCTDTTIDAVAMFKDFCSNPTTAIV